MTEGNIKVRLMTENDIEAAKDLMIELCKEIGVPFDDDRWDNSIKRRLSDDEIWGIHFLLIAESDKKPCGIAFCEVREDPIRSYDYYGYISNVFVLPKDRGKGIGRLLLNESIKSLNTNNIKRIRLNVRSELKELTQLVKDFGFKEVFKIMEKNS